MRAGVAVVLVSTLAVVACGDDSDEIVDSEVCADIDDIADRAGDGYDRWVDWLYDTFEDREINDPALAEAVEWMVDELRKPGEDVFGRAWAAASDRCDELGLS